MISARQEDAELPNTADVQRQAKSGLAHYQKSAFNVMTPPDITQVKFENNNRFSQQKITENHNRANTSFGLNPPQAIGSMMNGGQEGFVK